MDSKQDIEMDKSGVVDVECVEQAAFYLTGRGEDRRKQNVWMQGVHCPNSCDEVIM